MQLFFLTYIAGVNLEKSKYTYHISMLSEYVIFST